MLGEGESVGRDGGGASYERLGVTWGRKVAGGGRLRTGQGRAQRGAYWAVGRMWFTAQRREESCWPGVGFLREVKGVWRGMGVGGLLGG